MLDGLPVVSEIIETSETWMKLHWFLLHRGKPECVFTGYARLVYTLGL